jgi:hypothetical protein
MFMLTDNQKLLFEMLDLNYYFIVLHGSVLSDTNPAASDNFFMI